MYITSIGCSESLNTDQMPLWMDHVEILSNETYYAHLNRNTNRLNRKPLVMPKLLFSPI